jgi:hypothetical protein
MKPGGNMKKLILFMMVLSSTAFASNFWDSEFPDFVDKFIYEKVHFKCANADYVDGIIAYDEVDHPNGKTYVADFSMYGDIAEGFVAVDVTFEGELYLADLECPRI